jgi:hypothetical protein
MGKKDSPRGKECFGVKGFTQLRDRNMKRQRGPGKRQSC